VNRLVVLVTALVALVTAATVVWMEVRQEREFRRLVAEGDAALQADRTSEAIEAFSGALAFKPDSMLAHLQRAETYRRRGQADLAAALRDAREANSLDPTAPQPIELLGDVSGAMGHHHEAIDYYDKYLQLDDRGTRVMYKLALAYIRQGRPAQAIDPLRRAVALDERFAEAHYLLGLALRDRGNGDEALTELRKAVMLEPALIPAREELADLHLARGHPRDAIEQLEAIAALEPSRPERAADVALTLSRSGQREAAVVFLRRATERHPDSPVLFAALGRVWLDTAAVEDDPTAVNKAIAALQPMARRPDATSEVLALLGEAQLRAGNVAEAERTLQQAVARQPVLAVAYRHLADAARRRGHIAAARDAEARYLRLIPGA
jgi:tetratricopeptide (TPR) repeat protein